ncbi:MAG TPA: ferritin-like domain-containing protein, partial [Candidatus Limnocylindria bacterium]|nr:ferritin-like domain-containing protein [Candidatus Limnocylindria bacterium]
MSVKTSWSEGLLTFIGAVPAGANEAVEVLRQQYVWESQHATRYRQHAARMQYPQFRDALLRIADDESRHLEQIAEILRVLGSEPPGVPPIEPSRKNSWQYLLENLEAEQSHSDDLL